MSKTISIITDAVDNIYQGRTYGGVARYSLLLYKFLKNSGYDVIVGGPPSCSITLPSGLTALTPWAKMVSGSVDLVIANSPFGWNVPQDIPVIWVAHGAFAGSARARGATYKQRVWRRMAALIEKLSCKRADYVIAVSGAVSQVLEKFYKRAADRVILNGVDISFWRPKSKPIKNKNSLPVCLFVGSPSKAKGYDLFVQIAKNLEGKAKFIAILGYQPKRKPFHNKTGTVLEISQADEHRVRQLYQEADLLLHPSYWEGCSYVVIEAWACGVVTLLSPVGHISEIVRYCPWLRKFVINTDDPAVWTNCVQEILFQMGTSNMQGIRSKFRSLAEEFHSLERWEEEWLNIMRQFL